MAVFCVFIAIVRVFMAIWRAFIPMGRGVVALGRVVVEHAALIPRINRHRPPKRARSDAFHRVPGNPALLLPRPACLRDFLK